MASLGSLIPQNPHHQVQHVEIVTMKESILKSPLPQSLPSASISEITVEPRNQWYKDLHEYLKWGATAPGLPPIEKHTFK